MEMVSQEMVPSIPADRLYCGCWMGTREVCGQSELVGWFWVCRAVLLVLDH